MNYYSDEILRRYSKNDIKKIECAIKKKICKWVNIKIEKNNIDTVRYNKEILSQNFLTHIGIENTKNIYTIEEESLIEDFFELLIEARIALDYYKNDKLEIISNRYITTEDRDIIYILDGKVDIGYGYRLKNKKRETSWIKHFSSKLSLSRLDTIATLANILNMNIESLYRFTKNTHSTDMRQNNNFKNNELTNENWRNKIGLLNFKYIYGFSNQVVGAVYQIRFKENYFCIAGIVGRGELCVGHYISKAYFFNQDKINKNDDATILFFQDLRTAIEIDNLLKNDYSSIIPTAHLGHDISILDWQLLHRRKIIFFPAPTTKCIASIKGYYKFFRRHHTDLSIYLGFVLHSRPIEPTIITLSSLEKYLFEKCIYTDNIFNISNFLSSINDNTLSYIEYIKFCFDNNIFIKKHKSKLIKKSNIETSDFPPLDKNLKPKICDSLHQIQAYHIIRPGSYTLIYGSKGSGKTHLALSICNSLLKKNRLWSLFDTPDIGAENILYIDAETPYDEYKENLYQYELNTGSNKRLFTISKFEKNTVPFCRKFNLLDNDFQNGLKDYIIKNNCRFVIIDNLISIIGDNVSYGQQAQDVIQWIENLQALDISVTVMHHKSSEDKARGSQIFYDRARTVIQLKDKFDFASNFSSDDEINKYIYNGLTLGLNFEHCKAAPIIEKKIFWLNLPLKSTQWNLIKCTDIFNKQIQFSQIPINHVKKMCDDKDKIIKYFNDSGNKSIIQTKIASDLLQCGLDKARAILQEMTDEGILIQNDKGGRGKGYFLNPKY